MISREFHRQHNNYGPLIDYRRVTGICVGNLTIIGSDNGLSPGRRQASIWTNAELLLIGPWGTTFSEILIEIYTFSFKKMHLKMSSGKWWRFCLGLNVLNEYKAVSMVSGHVHHWHLVVTGLVAVITEKTIVAAVVCHIGSQTIMRINDTNTKWKQTKIVYCGSFPTQFWV